MTLDDHDNFIRFYDHQNLKETIIPWCLFDDGNNNCLICKEGFYVENGLCLKTTCPIFLHGCLSCNSTKCTKCKPGYSLIGTYCA